MRYSEFRLGDTLETQADAFVVKTPQLIYVHRGLTIMDRTSAVLVLALAAAFIPVAVLGEKSKYTGGQERKITKCAPNLNKWLLTFHVTMLAVNITKFY